jgi:hypothetical protein
LEYSFPYSSPLKYLSIYSRNFIAYYIFIQHLIQNLFLYLMKLVSDKSFLIRQAI